MASRALQERISALRRFNRFYTPQARRAGGAFSAEPVFARGGARALRARAGREQTDGEGGRPGARPRCRLSQPHPRRAFARARPDLARDLVAPTAAQSFLRAQPRRKSGVRAARPALAGRGRGDAPHRSPQRDQRRLVQAAGTIEATARAASARKSRKFRCAKHQVGDFGWIVEPPRRALRRGVWLEPEFRGHGRRHRCGLHQGTFDAKRERCWIAELDGARVGSVFARARGRRRRRSSAFSSSSRMRAGLASASGWSRSASASRGRPAIARSRCGRRAFSSPRARFISRAGFKKAREEPHTSFGKKLVGEYWELQL